VSGPRAGVDAAGVTVPEGVTGVVDVLFDGRRIFSVGPDKKGVVPAHVPWPEPMLRFLDGVAEVTLRDHRTSEALWSDTVVFAGGSGPIRIEDAEGRPVALTKWGRLNHPFDASDRDAIEGYLDQVEEVLAFLRDDCGRPAFLSYGSLLGAVREGGLIGHDVDVDVGYLSARTHPADVLLESYAIERRLRAHGWRVRRENGGFLALFLAQNDGTTRNLDVFTCFQVEDHLYQVHDTRIPGDATLVAPVRPVSFEGRELPGPARAEAMLEAAYGPGWRVPDPAFSFTTPRATRRRIMGWLGGIRDERDHWNDRWRKVADDDAPSGPSDLAGWAEQHWTASGPVPAQVVELGCGLGADAVHLAGQGYDVVAADLSAAALRSGRARARAAGVEVDFVEWNLNSLRETLARSALLARGPAPRAVYARGLVDALPGRTRPQLWTATTMLLAAGGRAYLELRTAPDPATRKRTRGNVVGHLDPSVAVSEASACGLRVVDRVDLDDTDPPVCRLVLERRATT
jgi:SAM-dependent methyltransferase